MTKFNETYQKIIRSIQRYQILDTIFQSTNTLGDILCESVLPSPYKLINDIIQKLKNDKKSFKYDKQNLKDLSDKDWKYFSLIDKLPEKFSLTIQNCQQYQLKKKYQYIKPVGMMMQFCSNQNDFEQHVWVGNYFNQYDEGFKNLLKHELGHVWTFIFGLSDEQFKDGQGPYSQKKILNQNDFNHYQNDVYLYLYQKNLKALNFDYNYILCKTSENDTANYQLSTNIDNIIQILIADYLENHKDIDTSLYLKNLFDLIKENKSFSNFSLLSYFKNNKKFKGYKDISSIKNPIRRLFLIFAFGTNEQIQYFKKQCQKEFGKIEEE